MKKLLMIASIALGVAGLMFLCLAILGYEKDWTLPAALGCNALALLYLSISRPRNKETAARPEKISMKKKEE